MKRILLVVFVLSMGNLAWAQSAPPLGSSKSFAILANTTVTNTGATLVKGDIGVSTGTAVTGVPPGILSEGTIHSNDALAMSAQADANAAYLALQGEGCGTNLSGLILGTSPGAVTLGPGVYCFAAGAQLTGALTLSGAGVYVFQLGTTLTTAADSSVVLANGATAENVFWKVGSSATLGANTSFTGSIFALTSDTVTAGSSVAGRVFALNGAVTLYTNTIAEDLAVGRWEIVHTTGDNSLQTAQFPGGFSTFLFSDGTGNTSATFANSICVINGEATNVVPTWVGLGGNNVQITITVDNLGEGPNFSMVYTGTYGLTPIPGDLTVSIPTITGTYAPGGDPASTSACSNATATSPGMFIATFLPTISSGSATGSLDGFSPGTTGGPAFDATVNATVAFSTPPSPGQMNGTVTLDSNPTFAHNACFATSMIGGPVNPLTINPSLSAQSGIILQIRAEGFDPTGAPTTLELDGYSANSYFTDTNTDPTANQIAAGEWAAGAAIGEDNPGTTPSSDGVANDGTNNVIVLFYGVVGGVCNGAGGADAPFHFVSAKPHIHGHRRHSRRGRSDRERDRGRTKVDRDRD
jgi:hypothetical protein